MPDTPQLSAVRRALLEKYLHGDLSQTAMAMSAGTQPSKVEVVDLRESVVAIQTGGSKRPFFFLHGDYLGGPVYCFPLARHLGSDQPFYVLEPYSFDGLRVPPTLETIAAAHVKSLRSVQPHGPYLLGGFCNGGTVAYEMARQLYAQGQIVELLVLMDPSPFAFLKLMRRLVNHFGTLLRLDQGKQLYWFLWLRHLYRYLQHLYRYLRFPYYRSLKTGLNPEQMKQNGGAIPILKDLHELKLTQEREHLDSNEQQKKLEGSPTNAEPGRLQVSSPTVERQAPVPWLGWGKALQSPFRFLLRLDLIFPDPIFPSDETLRKDYPGIFYWASADYVPNLYPGKSTFFFFRDNQRAHRRQVKWHKLAEVKDKEVEIHILVGSHDTCKTVYLHDLAERLYLCLSKAQEAK